MCIMEVRPGQRSATMLQAMAHNTKTIVSDLEMLRPILIARGDSLGVAQLDTAKRSLEVGFAELLAGFAAEITHDLTCNEPIGVDLSNERQHGHPHSITPDDRTTVAAALTTAEASALGGRAGFQASQWVAEAVANTRRAERYETRK